MRLRGSQFGEDAASRNSPVNERPFPSGRRPVHVMIDELPRRWAHRLEPSVELGRLTGLLERCPSQGHRWA